MGHSRSPLTVCLGLAITLGLAASTTSAAERLAFCGSRHVDIGEGFTLLQYMFDGSETFDLDYRPPPEAVAAKGVTVGPIPIHIVFTGFKDWASENPQIGFLKLDTRDADGRNLNIQTVRLDCGEGQSLSATFSNWPTQATGGYSPFFEERANIPACFQAMKRTGHYRLAFTGREDGAPTLLFEGSFHLNAKLREIHERWLKQTADAKAGLCSIMPSPPPIAIPPPPPPLRRAPGNTAGQR